MTRRTPAPEGKVRERVVYDPERRRMAVRIETAHPGWHVEWAVWRRCFFAYPWFPTPEVNRAVSISENELVNQMRRIESEAQRWQATGQYSPVFTGEAPLEPVSHEWQKHRVGLDFTERG